MHIVGSFTDSKGSHGFLDVNGTFTPIDVPGSTFISLSGINDAGQIVGSFSDANGAHGFLDVNNTFTAIDVPSAVYTGAVGINNSGQIVGVFGYEKGHTHRFLDVNGVFTTIDVPGSSRQSAGVRPCLLRPGNSTDVHSAMPSECPHHLPIDYRSCPFIRTKTKGPHRSMRAFI